MLVWLGFLLNCGGNWLSAGFSVQATLVGDLRWYAQYGLSMNLWMVVVVNFYWG